MKNILPYLPFGVKVFDLSRKIVLIASGAYFYRNTDTTFKIKLLNDWGGFR